MANPVIINPTLTLAGQAAAFNASNDGIELKMTHVSFGRDHYDPTGDELMLKSPVGSKVPLAGGSRPTQHQIRMVSSWREDVGEVPIGEIGFWAGDVLAFVWSKADGTIASYKTDGVSYVLFNDLAFAQVPAGSIGFEVDPGESVALAALAAHEGAANAHPQYLLRADVAKDSGPLAWLGLAAGTANALDLSLVAKESVLPDYAPGQRFQFRAKTTNTGAVTAKIAGLGVKSVKKAGDAGLIDVEAGDIKADALYDLNYDGTSFQLGGGVGSGKAFVRYSFTASVAQTIFTADHTIGATVVLRDGREVTDFLSDGAKITMRTPCDLGTSVEILAFKSFKVADTYTKAELQALLATASGVPVGAMLPFPRGVLPPGFLEVDGSNFDPLMYPDLAAYLGGSTLPESRGEFLRGWDHNRGKDPGRGPGTLQGSQLERHAHKDIGFVDNVESNLGAVGVNDAQPVSSIFGKVYGTAATRGKGYQELTPGGLSGAIGGLTSGYTGGSETRPSNLAVMWCIKAWNAPINQGTIDVGVLVSAVQGFMRDEATVAEMTTAPDPASKHWVSVRRFLAAAVLKADIDSPTFTGNPKGPTPSAWDKSKALANTEFVNASQGSFSMHGPISANRSLIIKEIGGLLWFSGNYSLALPKPSSLGLPMGAAVNVFTTSVGGSIVAQPGVVIQDQAGAPQTTFKMSPGQSLRLVAVSDIQWLVTDSTAGLENNSDFRQSKAVNGFRYLPGGMLECWGLSAPSTDRVNITFPEQFSQIPFVVPYDSSAQGATVMTLWQNTAVTTTGFIAQNMCSLVRGSSTVNGVTNSQCNWRAWGWVNK